MRERVNPYLASHNYINDGYFGKKLGSRSSPSYSVSDPDPSWLTILQLFRKLSM